MKHIDKRSEPKRFSRWKECNHEGTYEEMGTPVKKVLRNALMSEQGSLCCYCERRINNEDCHIEHFQPKDACPSLQLDYGNMHACCVKFPSHSTPNICGQRKGDFFSPELISPLEENCSSHFRYSYDGTIAPASNDRRAERTIEVLGLNDPFLIERRKAVLMPFIDGSLSIGEIDKMRRHYLQQDDDGRFHEFYTTIEQLF